MMPYLVCRGLLRNFGQIRIGFLQRRSRLAFDIRSVFLRVMAGCTSPPKNFVCRETSGASDNQFPNPIQPRGHVGVAHFSLRVCSAGHLGTT